MGKTRTLFLSALVATTGLLASCGVRPAAISDPAVAASAEPEESTIWDAFRRSNTEAEVQVNRYLWSASLEVLSFLPVETVDPFTGVIITGYGTPPGGSRAYRATILIDDPALNARSLNVSLQTRGAPADAATVRAIEDAILTRARQLRIADNRL